MIEALMTAAVLGLIGLIVLMFFITTSSVVGKVQAQGDLLSDLQTVGSNWAKDVMSSSELGISSNSQSFACISPYSENAAPTTSGIFSNLVWQSYRLYYVDSSRTLSTRILPLVPTTTLAQTLERYDLGFGLQPLNYYCNGGRSLAKDVDLMVVSQQGPLFTLTLQASRKRYGSNQPEQVKIDFAAAPRNR